MKKLLLFTFAICLMPFAFSQQYGWTDISANMPALGGFNDVHFMGEEGWITGGNNEVFYTPNGGETFQIQTLPENSGISSSVFMKTNQEGYVVTYSGKILHNEDGGSTWTMLHELGGTLNSVHFPPSSSTGYTCGENGKVYSFSNAVSDIADISPAGIVSSLQSIFFPVDTSEGKFCGQNIIRRYLSGSWDNLQFFDNGFLYNSIFFANNSVGWAVGSQGKIYKTIDGTSWVAQTSNTTKNLNDVFFINSSEGWAAGTEVLLHTVDGGTTWTQELSSQTVGKDLRAIYFTSANYGYFVGNGVVFKYGEVFGIAEEVSVLEFEVFPNPCLDMITIRQLALGTNVIPSEAEGRYSILEIVDYSGKVVLRQEMERVGEEEVIVDVSHLSSGLYLVKLQTEDAVGVRKIIKK